MNTATASTPIKERQDKPSRPFADIGRHISYSQVNMFDRCQLSWYLKYVKGIAKKPTVQMLLGQCYHKALALNFEEKRVTGIDLPANDVVLHFTSTFDDAVARGEIDSAPGLGFDSYRDPVARLLRHYYEEYVVDKMEPVLTEHEYVMPIPNCDRVFAGIIDVQLSDGTMIDFKVASRRWSGSEVTENKQATAYAMLSGRDVDFEFHIGLRANVKPAVQIVKMRRTQDEVDAYVRHLQSTVSQMKDIESGTADPFPRTGFCNEKMCQYYQECQDWKYGGLA